MTACPTRFESSVCQTPSTPVTIGIATMPATSPIEEAHLDCCLGRVDVSTWIAVSSTSRSRNAGTTPSAAEITIRPETSPSRAL